MLLLNLMVSSGSNIYRRTCRSCSCQAKVVFTVYAIVQYGVVVCVVLVDDIYGIRIASVRGSGKVCEAKLYGMCILGFGKVYKSFYYI
jgi:hypothetical protein